MMRIITGTARGVHLDTLEGSETRPTSERFKEALFSMIQFDIEGREVLDLFGGSGQLGLEALSRGASSATFIDSSRAATDIIMANAKKCKLFDKCRISAMDSTAYLRSVSGRQSYDIIFIDPPYNSGLVQKSLELIADGNLLSPGGTVAVETGVPETKKRKRKNKETDEEVYARVLDEVFGGDSVLAEKFNIKRTASYGASRLTLLGNKE